MTDQVPTVFTCKRCGIVHDIPAYVYAHWDERLTHTCGCGAKHTLLSGVVKPVATVGRKGKQ